MKTIFIIVNGIGWENEKVEWERTFVIGSLNDQGYEFPPITKRENPNLHKRLVEYVKHQMLYHAFREGDKIYIEDFDLTQEIKAHYRMGDLQSR